MARPEISFWRSVRGLPGTDLLGWVTGWSLLIGIPGGVALLASTEAGRRVSIAGDFLVLTAPLLGVVFAAFALVIALFSDDYLVLLEESEEGTTGFLRPFLVAIGLQVGALLTVLTYRAGSAALVSAGVWGSRIEVGLFLVMVTLVAMALLDVLALAQNVMLHGLARARSARIRRLEDDAKASRLDHRRQGKRQADQ